MSDIFDSMLKLPDTSNLFTELMRLSDNLAHVRRVVKELEDELWSFDHREQCSQGINEHFLRVTQGCLRSRLDIVDSNLINCFNLLDELDRARRNQLKEKN